MKRKSLIALLLLCLLLAGCARAADPGSGAPDASTPAASGSGGAGSSASTDPASEPEPEAAPVHHFQNSIGTYVVEVGSVLYFTIGEYLGFYDNETGESGPLCGRPECMHQDYKCDAYLNYHPILIGCVEGKLYWLGCAQRFGKIAGTPIQFGFWRSNLDGTDREQVKPYPEDVSNAVQRLTFHNEKVYLETLELTVTDAVPENHYCIYETDLTEAGAFRKLLDVPGNVTFQITGNYVYYSSYVHQGDMETFATGLELYRYDLETGRTEQLLTADAAGEVTGSFYVCEDGSVYVADNRQDVTSERLYRLDAGQLLPVPGTADDSGVFRTPFLSECLACALNKLSPERQIWLYDLDGSTIYKGVWDIHFQGDIPYDPTVMVANGFLGGGSDFFLILFTDMRTHGWIVRYEIAPRA